MQDKVNLYMAFDVTDNTANMNQDMLSFAIDVLNYGGSQAQPDDVFFYMRRNGTLAGANGTSLISPPMGGWSGSASSTNDYWQADFNITYAKVQIIAGLPKTLGIALVSMDDMQPGWWLQ